MISPRTVELHPEAMNESRAAREWYTECNPALGTAFMNELDRVIQQIREAPDRWMNYRGNTRRYLMKRFPFAVVYRFESSVIQVLAIAHTRRAPGYWMHRTNI